MKQIRTFAAAFLLLVSIASLSAPWWIEAPYERQFRNDPDGPPSKQFLLGTDGLGRDRLSRLMYGTRISLLMAPASALISCLAAAVLGGVAGFLGGWIDRLISSMADLFLSVPWLLLLLIVRAMLPLNVPPLASVTITFVMMGALGWAAPSRVVRAAVARIRTSDFAVQARANGISPARLVMRQLIPNAMPVLRAQFWIAIPVYILTEATLGMIGLGVAEPLPSWAACFENWKPGRRSRRYWLFAPAILLAGVVGCLQLAVRNEDDAK